MSGRPDTPHPKDDLQGWLKKVGYQESRTVEKLMEHLFLAELLQECWFRRGRAVEVLRAEVDAAGYDLVLELDGRIRHVQLKASLRGGKTARQTINKKLAQREGGCVVWVTYDVDEEKGRARLTYRWWDSEVKTLPAIPGINPLTKKEKPNSAVLKRAEFESVESTKELVDLLFGEEP